jgi:DNA-binding Lrp family transcriptional regulator
MKKKRKKREPDELDRRILAKLQSWGGPLPPEELDRRMLAKIEELRARTEEKRTAEEH